MDADRPTRTAKVGQTIRFGHYYVKVLEAEDGVLSYKVRYRASPLADKQERKRRSKHGKQPRKP